MPGRVKCKPVGTPKELLGSGTVRAYKSGSSLSGGKIRQHTAYKCREPRENRGRLRHCDGLRTPIATG